MNVFHSALFRFNSLKLLVILTIFIQLILPDTYAQTVTTSKNDCQFLIETPNLWKADKDFLGMPLVFSGPYDNKFGRSSLSVTVTGLQDPGFDPKDLKASESRYFQGRRKWLDAKEGQWLKEFNFENFKSSQGHKIYSIGFQYIFGGKEFSERSFFYFCPESMVHMKLLLTKKDQDKYAEILNIIKKGKCEKVPNKNKK